MRAQDVHALFQGRFAHAEGHEALAHPVDVHLVPGLELRATCHQGVQAHKALAFGLTHGLLHAFALGLALVEEGTVVLGKRLQTSQLLLVILLPGILLVHRNSFLSHAVSR